MDREISPTPERRAPSSLYRIVFQGADEHCELYAARVAQGHLPAFLEIDQIVFGERPAGTASAAQERLRSALAAAKRCYIPLARVVRIDEIAYEAVHQARDEPTNAAGDDHRYKVAALRAAAPRPK